MTLTLFQNLIAIGALLLLFSLRLYPSNCACSVADQDRIPVNLNAILDAQIRIQKY